jgi:hypothetical protein
MNKLLLSIATLSFSFSAYAGDLTILNTGSKSGSWAGLTTAINSDFAGADFQNPGKHCVAINSNLKTIKSPVLFPWGNDLEAAGRDGDGCATVNITKDEVIGYTSSPLFVCAMDNKDFLKISGKVGHPTPAHAYARLVKGVNSSFGTNHTSIDYNGSGDARAALLSGEVDYFVGTGKHAKRLAKKGAICSYNSGATGLISLDKSNPDLQLEFTTVIVLKNADTIGKMNISNKLQKNYADVSTAFGTLTAGGKDINYTWGSSSFDLYESSVSKMQK